MRKLFISFVTAVLLASCSADSLMKETELDLTDTEKVYSDIDVYKRQVQGPRIYRSIRQCYQCRRWENCSRKCIP